MSIDLVIDNTFDFDSEEAEALSLALNILSYALKKSELTASEIELLKKFDYPIDSLED